MSKFALAIVCCVLCVSACTANDPPGASRSGPMPTATATPSASTNSDLEAACRDNRDRAFRAADQTKDAALPRDEARRQASIFVREVRDVPSCFAASVREEAEIADKAIQRGEVPKLRGTVGIL